MKRFLVLMTTILVFSGLALAKESQLQKANNVMNEIMRTPEKGIPHDLLEKAVCVGIVPSEIKGAILVGGTYGRGVLVCRRHGNGPWGPPSMFTLGAGSFGFQIGGEATDVVFLVMNGSGAKKLVEDKVTLGGDVSVAAGPVGRNAKAATDAQLHAEILSYSRSRGLFAGVSIQGAVFKTDHDANEELYGKRMTSKELLIDGEAHPPAAAAPLEATLAHYSVGGGHRTKSLQ